MEHEDWLQRWREGRTGWHQHQVTPLLAQHWTALHVAPGTQVLVPLCGKTLDMLWLAEQGLDVLGMELSELAVQQFFADNGLQAERTTTDAGPSYCAGRITVVVGDIFAAPAGLFSRCGAIYDRAALIALSADQRRRYARDVYGRLPAGSRGLLIALEYDATRMQGPPFSVPESEVEALLAADWDVELRQRRRSDGPARGAGAPDFHAAVYGLTRR